MSPTGMGFFPSMPFSLASGGGSFNHLPPLPPALLRAYQNDVCSEPAALGGAQPSVNMEFHH